LDVLLALVLGLVIGFVTAAILLETEYRRRR
jgi:hypothetical protein